MQSLVGIVLPLVVLAACTTEVDSAATPPGTTGADSGSSAGTMGVGAGGAAATSTGSSSTGGDAPTAAHWVSAYYVGYQMNIDPPEEIAWEDLTHLMIGVLVPNADGSLDTDFDLGPDSGPAFAQELVSLAHRHGRKALFMIGGSSTHDGWVGAASDANQAKFIQNLVSLVEEVGADGLDFDWEPLYPEEQPRLRAVVEGVRAALPSAILTIPVNWVNANAPQVDGFFGEVAPLFDQINVMTYGMAGAYEGWTSWHSSALKGESPSSPASIDSSVKAYLEAGVPASKLGVGAGFYGSCWSAPVTGPSQGIAGSQIVASDYVMTFDHVMTHYYSDGAYAIDEAAQVPYLSFESPHGPEGCTFVSYEDETSLSAKADYIRASGLGGIIVWNLNEGHRAGAPAGARDPLAAALAKGLLE